MLGQPWQNGRDASAATIREGMGAEDPSGDLAIVQYVALADGHASAMDLSEIEDTSSNVSDRHSNRRPHKTLLYFAAFGLIQCSPTNSPESVVTVQREVVAEREVAEALATTMAASYVDAEVGRAIGEAVRSRAQRGAYDALDGQTLAAALESDARGVVDDRHIQVRFDPAHTNDPAAGIPSGPMAGPPPSLDVQRQQAANAISFQLLDEQLGYLKVDEFVVPEASAEVFTAAMRAVHDKPTLIVDLRTCRGGSPAAVAFLLSFLIDNPPQLVSTATFRNGEVRPTKTSEVGAAAYGPKRPVFVLVSHRTFSGGEEFAYDIQAMKRGVIVGEVTGGGAHPGAVAKLGHGFDVFVPIGRTVNPITGTSWETVGVKPEVEAPAPDALAAATALAKTQLEGAGR
jgi:hypothetical protein